MVRLTLYGIPKRLWNLIVGLFQGGLGIILWRLFLIVAVPLAIIYVFALVGPGGLAALALTLVLSTIFGYFYRDDIIAIGKNLWNFEWGEARL